MRRRRPAFIRTTRVYAGVITTSLNSIISPLGYERWGYKRIIDEGYLPEYVKVDEEDGRRPSTLVRLQRYYGAMRIDDKIHVDLCAYKLLFLFVMRAPTSILVQYAKLNHRTGV